MADALGEVLAFFDEWQPTLDAMLASMAQRFTDKTVWENHGLSRTVGFAEAKAFMDAFVQIKPVERAEVIVHHAAANGNVVLTERTDNFFDRHGNLIVSLELMGRFVMDGPRIVTWRDYFDTAKGF